MGKVHVAAGFVDLSVLLVAKLVESPVAGPLRFVGYDLAAYAVAKTMVIWEIANGRDDPESADLVQCNMDQANDGRLQVGCHRVRCPAAR